LHFDLIDVWRCFIQLNQARDTINGLAPLRVSEIAAWLNVYAVEAVEQRAYYFELVQSLDSTWLRWARNKEQDGDSSNRD